MADIQCPACKSRHHKVVGVIEVKAKRNAISPQEKLLECVNCGCRWAVKTAPIHVPSPPGPAR